MEGKRFIVAMLTVGTAVTAAAFDPHNMVYVSEVFRGSETVPPFVELYNASSADVSLYNWRVRLYTSRGNEQFDVPYGAKIPSRGFFLLGKETDKSRWGELGVQPDCYVNAGMEFFPEKGGVILYKNNGDVRDALGWGTPPAPFYEGKPQNAPASDESIERKSSPLHSEQGGNAYDTGDNATDTYLRIHPQPQNNASPRETPSASTESAAWGRIRAIYYRDE